MLWFHFPDAQGNDWVGHYGGMNGVAAAMWLLAGDNVRYVVIVNQADIGAVGRACAGGQDGGKDAVLCAACG